MEMAYNTPPPSQTSPQAFRLPPLPAFNRPGDRRPARDSLSTSFSLGPESLVDNLQLAPGTPGGSSFFALGGEDGSFVDGGGAEFDHGANNSSLLPCSPRITTTAQRSIRRAQAPNAPGGRRLQRPGSASFDLSGSSGGDLSAFQLGGRSPAFGGLGGPGPTGRNLDTPPVRSRLRFGGGFDRSVETGLPPGVTADDSSFVQPIEEVGAELEDEEDGEPEDAGAQVLIEKMRMWRHDAMLQHLYETAAFWGDKVLTWTGDKNDAFWLAQIHFLTTHYSRALRLLLSPIRPARPPRAPYLDPEGKGKQRADDSDFLEEDDQEFDEGLGGLEDHRLHGLGMEDWQEEGGKRMVDISLACRYLAGQCQVRTGLFQDALEMLGTSNPFQGTALSGPKVKSDGGFKLESSMCLLRGQIHLRLSNTQEAKQAFLEALSLDVRCYDAFQALVGGEMMSVDEEWDFIQSLCFSEQTEECAEFIRMVYTVRLKKFKHLREITAARKRLEKEYSMEENADVLFGRADALYAQYRWSECWAITSKILSAYPSHSATLPLHLACMHHLPRLRSSLFLLAHTLAESAPDEATSWYAVGLWYYTGSRWGEARRFFGKASLMDPRFGAAWIAFAHSFAMEKEHDQAITAYSTAARLFQGSHLPMLHIGMEHLQMQNIDIASGNFESAFATCQTDPLLFNEMGVVAYSRGDYISAVDNFSKALDAAVDMQGSPVIWASTHLNLGHALRKTRRYSEALDSYAEALRLDPICDSAFAGQGLVYQLQGRWNEAIECYHEALSLNPQSAHATTLLNLALDASVDLLGPLRSIGNLPDALLVDPLQSFSQASQDDRTGGQAELTGDDLSRSFVNATEEGSTMEIEDSM